MSRIIVKNIGRNCHENQLKELFSQKGEITDVKIVSKKNPTATGGKGATAPSRNFAFIGFRTDLQAQEAIRYFHNTFIGLSRIQVELARKLGDSHLLEEKAKHGKTSKEKLKELQEKMKKEKAEEEEEEQEDVSKGKGKGKGQQVNAIESGVSRNKKEFLEIVKKGGTMQSKSLIANPLEEEEQEEREEEDEEDEDEDDDSAVDLEDLLKANEEASKAKKATVPAAASTAPPLSDLDYLKSKMVRKSWSDDEEEEQEKGSDDDSEEEEENEKMEVEGQEEGSDHKHEKTEKGDAELGEEQGEKEKGEEEEEDDDDCRLYLRNIPYSCTEDELKALGERFGTVSEVHIPLEKKTKDDKEGGGGGLRRGNKGFGFITFLFPADASKALNALHGNSFQGRLLYVTKAKKLKEKEIQAIHLNSTAAGEAGGYGKRLSSFQLQKEEERRKALGKKENWNASFIRSDAILENISERYGITQSNLLNTGELKSADLAVRLAVAETQIIQENKEYFQNHGIHLDVLESVNSKRKSSERSTTTLLIKNLPPDTDSEELESMFAK